ncbi:MAG: hypothetical protein NVS3B10_10010 [Polyangiales bacterium]
MPYRTAPQSPLRLDTLRIASPCRADWSSMPGDDRVRHCSICGKHVYQLSAMTSDEANALLAANDEAPCVRLYRRSDGAVMTSDCAVGRTDRTRRRVVLAVVGAMTTATSLLALQAAVEPAPPPHPRAPPSLYERLVRGDARLLSVDPVMPAAQMGMVRRRHDDDDDDDDDDGRHAD